MKASERRQFWLDYVQFMKSDEPEWVEGEILVNTEPLITYNYKEKKDETFKPGTLFKVFIEWMDSIEGVEMNCFVLGVVSEHSPYNGIVIPKDNQHIFKSVDPVWSRPISRPYGIQCHS